MYIISACLLGENCRYNGGNNLSDWVKAVVEGKPYIAVCPEVSGGLPTPRSPAELVARPTEEGDVFCDGGRQRFVILDREGREVTEAFLLGAERALQEAQKAADESGNPIELAILKANSPSCGCGNIYDGTFTGTLISGDGVFAALLKRSSIPVITERDEEKFR